MHRETIINVVQSGGGLETVKATRGLWDYTRNHLRNNAGPVAANSAWHQTDEKDTLTVDKDTYDLAVAEYYVILRKDLEMLELNARLVREELCILPARASD